MSGDALTAQLLASWETSRPTAAEWLGDEPTAQLLAAHYPADAAKLAGRLYYLRQLEAAELLHQALAELKRCMMCGRELGSDPASRARSVGEPCWRLAYAPWRAAIARRLAAEAWRQVQIPAARSASEG